jgi:hypothetical protein
MGDRSRANHQREDEEDEADRAAPPELTAAVTSTRPQNQGSTAESSRCLNQNRRGQSKSFKTQIAEPE